MKNAIVILAAVGMMASACGNAPVPPAATQSAPAAAPATKTPALSGLSGEEIFKKNCQVCHGADGKLGLNGAKDLTVSVVPVEERVQIITNGKNVMTPFKEVLHPDDIKAVADYTLTLQKK